MISPGEALPRTQAQAPVSVPTLTTTANREKTPLMTTYEPPTDQTLFAHWFESILKDDPDADRDAAAEAFHATIESYKAEALRLAAAASVDGIPSTMSTAQWLEVQAMVYSEAPSELTHTGVQPSRYKAAPEVQRIVIGRPELAHTPEPLTSGEAASQVLLGAACAIEASRFFGSNLRATVGIVLRNAAQATWGNEFSYRVPASGTILMPRPHIPYGPKGISTEKADADYLHKAASDLESFYTPFSPDTRRMVVILLHNVAHAVGQLEPKTFAEDY